MAAAFCALLNAEGFEVGARFMFITITTRNYSGAFIALRPYQKDYAFAKPAQTLQSLFTIFPALIFHRNHRGVEYTTYLSQVNAVILGILLSLGFVPGDHALIVVTKCKSCQAFCSYSCPIVPPDLREKPRRPVNSDVEAVEKLHFTRGRPPQMAWITPRHLSFHRPILISPCRRRGPPRQAGDMPVGQDRACPFPLRRILLRPAQDPAGPKPGNALRHVRPDGARMVASAGQARSPQSCALSDLAGRGGAGAPPPVQGAGRRSRTMGAPVKCRPAVRRSRGGPDGLRSELRPWAAIFAGHRA